jgi:hypothetical protein
VIGSPLASVIIFAILAFSVTAIAITSLVIGYLEKRNTLSQRGRSEELHFKYHGSGGGPAGQRPRT